MKTAILLVASAAITLAGCSKKAEPRHDLPPLTVSVAQVAGHEFTGALTASGRLLPREEVAVGADLNGYRIARVLVEEGAFVHQGQVLAVLDDSLIRSQVGQVQASLAQQQIAAAQAREQAARVDGLDGAGVLSEEAIRNRRNAARSAAAAAAVTQAQLGDIVERRSHLVIRAPRDGIVTERTARPGDTSSTASVMFRIARGGLVELHAELPEADAARLAPGDPAQVALASGLVVPGTVRLIGARVDEKTGLVAVRIGFARTAEARQGGFAEAHFTRVTSVVAVPEAAVQYDSDGASVKLVDAQNRIHPMAVKTGRHVDGWVELRDGPPPGARVAVKGAAFTLDNDLVRVTADGGR
ncbi:MAG: hypothetical protein RL367_2890 [Pseudomonadota bacterium]|jgi:HlyD family secretion protein